jgi:hypothetical protein
MNTSRINQPRTIFTLAVATILMVACTSGAAAPAASPRTTPDPPVDTTPSPKAKPTPTPAPPAIVGGFDVGGAGWSMTKAGDALWIQVDAPVDAIVRVDIATGTVTKAVPLGWKAKSGPEGLWVICCDWLAKVDPATGEETLRIPMGGTYALADGAVWLANDDGLHRIDALTGDIGRPVGPALSSVCGSGKDMVIAFDSAWLACKEGKVVRIDLTSGDAVDIPTSSGAHTLALAGEAVWVTNYQANSVSRIDPDTNEVTTIPGAGNGAGITSGGGYVWVGSPTGIAKIDPETATIVGEVRLGRGEYYELVWDDGIIWVSTRWTRILKVDPSRAN